MALLRVGHTKPPPASPQVALLFVSCLLFASGCCCQAGIRQARQGQAGVLSDLPTQHSSWRRSSCRECWGALGKRSLAALRGNSGASQDCPTLLTGPGSQDPAQVSSAPPSL